MKSCERWYGGKYGTKLLDGFPICGELELNYPGVENPTINILAREFAPGNNIRGRKYGICHSLKGVTHAKTAETTFRRAGMYEIKDWLWVIIEWDKSPQVFKSSRDRFFDDRLEDKMKKKVAEFLRACPSVRALHERKYREMVSSAPENMTDTIREMFEKNKDIRGILSNRGLSDKMYEREVNDPPTFFNCMDSGSRIVGSEYAVVRWKTDAPTDLFSRNHSPWQVILLDEDYCPVAGVKHSFVQGEIFQLKIPFDRTAHQEGDTLSFRMVVRDGNKRHEISEPFILKVSEPREPGKVRGNGSHANKSQGLNLPTTYVVGEDDWERHGMDKFTPCRFYPESFSIFINRDCEEVKRLQRARKLSTPESAVCIIASACSFYAPDVDMDLSQVLAKNDDVDLDELTHRMLYRHVRSLAVSDYVFRMFSNGNFDSALEEGALQLLSEERPEVT